MADHYYSRQPQTDSARRVVEMQLRGLRLRLATDSGVFAKAGVDYGSRQLIEAMVIPPGAQVLDVGCGYGPIGISAALLEPSSSVTMVDVNERAVELASENAANNDARNVEVLQSDLFESVQGRQFDVIVTNPPIRAGKAVVHRIFEEGASLLTANGSMWVVIQKKQGAPSAKAKLERLFGEVEEAAKAGGYKVLRASRKK
ncbi:class I SAM-dependent methyltransferase [Paenibacillus sp. IB182496]|uniref:Class I SAM-dependent methyltransferase n=1 Tax=Paenibacillus sabuli TaxID=2772509 RepID=A0A927BSQ3_9BACL|nr:class I SAM-dependent methyltransferase [Paenibacillus sabuli]MBD2844733.1 class I SAM-dependent methyltransferase [Paenibacillus sabuli]